MVAASTTVGTPIATTGIPSVFLVSSFLRFPTPAPGSIPVSVICTVVQSLCTLLDANASTTITKSGFVFRIIPCNTSSVSIPVCAMTPGAIALTQPYPFSCIKDAPNSSLKCLVTKRASVIFGPNESEVTSRFPNPTTKTLFLRSPFIILSNCSQTQSKNGSLSSISP